MKPGTKLMVRKDLPQERVVRISSWKMYPGQVVTFKACYKNIKPEGQYFEVEESKFVYKLSDVVDLFEENLKKVLE